MIKKLLLILPIALCTGAAMDVASNSAPASSSGAPGETDCTTSGCHDTYAVNSGPGSVSIAFENSISEYVPGQTYTVSVLVQQGNLIRFGFQLVALDAQNKNAGALRPIDNSRNQVTTGFSNLADRKYMTYTFASTRAMLAGFDNWSFEWIAPPVDQGKITFYVAGLAADNNGNDAGDYCYTKNVSLLAKQTTLPADFALTVSADPAAEVLYMKYDLPEDATVKIELVNAMGQVLQETEANTQVAGRYNVPFNYTKAYGTGVYYLRFIHNGKIEVKKILLAR